MDLDSVKACFNSIFRSHYKSSNYIFDAFCCQRNGLRKILKPFGVRKYLSDCFQVGSTYQLNPFRQIISMSNTTGMHQLQKNFSSSIMYFRSNWLPCFHLLLAENPGYPGITQRFGSGSSSFGYNEPSTGTLPVISFHQGIWKIINGSATGHWRHYQMIL